MSFQPIIGLEVHIELNTKSKMFCGCPNDPNERHPNVNICPVCTAQPGTLPVINEEAVKKVIKTGLALNCQIPEHSKFDRKNYFYPDLPKGYQISQYDMPLCLEGYLEINGKKIKIRRVHLEEDTGRLVHPVRDQRARGKAKGKQISNGVHEKDYSLVDFNRAGIPLMELVTEPDIGSAKEAKKFAEALHLILHYLDVSDADMEKGQMRVEVNISLSKKDGGLGTKVEIKNLNSFRSVERAIDYEIERQTKILKAGKKITQETRGWLDEATASSRTEPSKGEGKDERSSSDRVAGARVDNVKGITVSQREKEEAHDYRYFPEPDLPKLYHPKKFIEEIQAEIPELPRQRKERLVREYQLDEKNVEIFVYNKDLGQYFEKVISELPPHLSPQDLPKLTKLASNYLITDLQGLLKGTSLITDKFLITPENFAEFITLIYEGKVSSKIAKMILEEMFKTGADPSHVVEEKGLVQITDVSEIEKIIKAVVSQNKKAVEDFKKGKEGALQYLIGQIMAQSKGRVNPQIAEEILRNILVKAK